MNHSSHFPRGHSVESSSDMYAHNVQPRTINIKGVDQCRIGVFQLCSQDHDTSPHLIIHFTPLHRDLPLAVWIGMLLVTAVYVLTNAAYFSVLNLQELLASDAVAVVSRPYYINLVYHYIPKALSINSKGIVIPHIN